MRAPGALKTATRYVAGWMIVILFAGLLTFIFSFLGAFFCAALAGMMLGSFKLPRWQTIALSFTFPVVLVGVLRGGGSELPVKQVMLLSVLCLGTFWVTFLVVRAVVFYEHKGQSFVPVTSAPNTANHAAVPAGKLDLQVLQGKWSCISPNQNSGTERKCLEIQREIVLLTIRDPAGKISFRARGELELRDGGAIPLRTISKGIPQPDDTQVCI